MPARWSDSRPHDQMLQCEPARLTGEPDGGAVSATSYSSKKSAAALLSASRNGKHVSSKACQAEWGIREFPLALLGEGRPVPTWCTCRGESESDRLEKESLLPCRPSSKSTCNNTHWLHHFDAHLTIEMFVGPHKTLLQSTANL